MTSSSPPLYAARLNAFKLGAAAIWPEKNRITSADLIARAASVEGLNSVDLNYPDHFDDHTPAEMRRILDDHGMQLNGLAMRYYTDPGFKLGAFTHPDAAVRQTAIDITLQGIDALAEMGGKVMTLWMGQDGFDYSFQLDYQRAWDHTIHALQCVTAHHPAIDIAIEYKPNEPRCYALMPDVATTLLAVKETGAENLGVTLDFAHVLYADEMPAHTLSLIQRHSKLLGVHLNDGYGRRDDGLMVGTVHPIQTLELLVALEHAGHAGTIYFDTFPDQGGLDPVAECRTNIIIIEQLRQKARQLCHDSELIAAIARQDAATSMRIVSAALYHD